MATGTQSREDEVLQKIASCLEEEPNKLIVISKYYSTADQSAIDGLVKVLYPLINKERILKDYLEMLFNDIVRESLVSSKSSENVKLPVADFGGRWNVLKRTLPASLSYNLIKAFEKLPEPVQTEILQQEQNVNVLKLGFLNQNGIFATCARLALKLTTSNKATEIAIGYFILTAYWDTYVEMNRWKDQKVSGKLCIKNIIDNMATSAGQLGGGYAGAIIGTSIKPGIGKAIDGIWIIKESLND